MTHEAKIKIPSISSDPIQSITLLSSHMLSNLTCKPSQKTPQTGIDGIRDFLHGTKSAIHFLKVLHSHGIRLKPSKKILNKLIWS